MTMLLVRRSRSLLAAAMSARCSGLLRSLQGQPYPRGGVFMARRGLATATTSAKPSSQQYDAIVVGGGHNGLIAAAYMAKDGLKPLVIETRDVIGGAAISEEIVPGFKFSRASYLAGLLRPSIISDLDLMSHGLKYLPRDPSSFTPTHEEGKFLMFWDNENCTRDSIAQFSKADAKVFAKYEEEIAIYRDMIQPFLDGPLPDIIASPRINYKTCFPQLWTTFLHLFKYRKHLSGFYEILTAPAAQILNRWFESEVLKVTLATDAVIGSMASANETGSAYVLLHHVMGEAAGKQGVWSYVEGGMGAISQAIARSAVQQGVEIVTSTSVQEIQLDEKGQVNGVLVKHSDGSRQKLYSPLVLSNCTPHRTFTELLSLPDQHQHLPEAFRNHVNHIDYSSGTFKINCAVSELPNFLCCPNDMTNGKQGLGPQHMGTIHFETEMAQIEQAASEAKRGIPAQRPVIEMTIPTSADPTLAPPGKHVVQLFVQYAPYHVDPKIGTWHDEAFKKQFVDRVFGIIDMYAPNFSKSVIGYDALSPVDLERIFGLKEGNIFHGSMGLNQLMHMRPAPAYANGLTPINGLVMCGSGVHPGGGVMGACGRNAVVTLRNHNSYYQHKMQQLP